MLPKGEYLGGLYDIGFDKPEGHVVAADGKLHYAFYANRGTGRSRCAGSARAVAAHQQLHRRPLGSATAATTRSTRNSTNSSSSRRRPQERRHDDDCPAPSGRAWLINALITVVLWGVWGALSDQSPKHGFPDTLVYCVWAVTMIPPAFIALRRAARSSSCHAAQSPTEWRSDCSARAGR